MEDPHATSEQPTHRSVPEVTTPRAPGIVLAALVCSCLGFICLIPAVIGLILAIVGRKRAEAIGQGVGMSTAAILIALWWLVGGLALVAIISIHPMS